MEKNECFENFKEVFQKKTKYCKKKYSIEDIKNVFEELIDYGKNAFIYDNDDEFFEVLNEEINNINNILPKDEYGMDKIYRYFYEEFCWDITDEQITENFSDKEKEKYIDKKIRKEKYFEDDGRFNDYILSDFVLFFWEE